MINCGRETDGVRLRFPGFRALGDELLEVQGGFHEEWFEATNSSLCGKEHAADPAFDLVDGQGTVDPVGRVPIQMRVRGEIGRECVEVVQDCSRAEVLPRRMSGQASGTLPFQAMRYSLRRLLNSRATVV